MDANQLGHQFATANTAAGEDPTQETPLSFSYTPMPPSTEIMQQLAWRELPERAHRHTRKMSEGWIPRELSHLEVEEHRLLTQRSIDNIRMLEHVLDSNPPNRPEVDHELFWARVNYRAIFGRIFRIDDLPTEILTDIFHLVAWSVLTPGKSIVQRTHLASVSRHWRTVATQDNILWNAIWFLPYRYETGYLWLTRAGNATLDIRINDDNDNPLDSQAASRMIDAVFEKASTIRSLVVMVRDWEPALLFYHKLRELGEKNIPLCLQRLQLHRTGLTLSQPGPGFTQELLNPAPLFGGAYVPSLRSLSIDGFQVDWDNSNLPNLVNFDIRRQPLDKAPSLPYFQRLISSPDLISLVVISAGPQLPTPPPGTVGTIPLPLPMEQVKLSKLKSLVLGGYSLLYGSYLTRAFCAPNVVDLTIAQVFGADNEYRFFFKGLECMPSILSLSLYNMGPLSSDVQAAAFLSWLKTVPLLTYLRLVNVHKSVLNVFVYEPNGTSEPSQTNSPLCPKLQFLELVDIPEPAYVVQLIHKRNAMGLPLRRIYVQNDTIEKFHTEQPTILPTLRALVGRDNVLPLPRGERPGELSLLL